MNNLNESYLEKKLQKWLESVSKWHDHFIWTPNLKPAWFSPRKPLNQSRVALVSTSGVHLRSQEPFDTKNEAGDWSYRRIPSSIVPEELMISDEHYDHSEVDNDINCIFPITHLQALLEQGLIGSIADTYYGFMGFVPNPKKLIQKTAPEVAQSLKEEFVDIVLLTPG